MKSLKLVMCRRSSSILVVKNTYNTETATVDTLGLDSSVLQIA